MSTLKGDFRFRHCRKGHRFAIVVRSFDGFVARATGTSRNSVNSLIRLPTWLSFGMLRGPGIHWVSEEFCQANSPYSRIHEIGWWVGLAFAICCAWRLPGSISGMAPGGGSRTSSVCRAPRPPAARGLGSRNQNPIEDWRWSVVWMGVVTARRR